MLEFKTQVLESIAKGASLDETLTQLCRDAEQFFTNAAVTVISLDAAGLMHLLAAPAFPETYRIALDGIPIGPQVGSCGSAIYLNEMVEVADIETDRRWALFKKLVSPLGFRACTSWPICDRNGAIGAVAIYLRDKRLLTEAEQQVARQLSQLCELAFARQARVTNSERRAMIDALTGLPNRRAFDEALSQLRCELPGSWALFVMDIDNLKTTNDIFGHDAGDALIRDIGPRIAATLASDTTFRTGGDEFTSIIQDEDCLRDLHATAARVLEAVHAPARYNDNLFLPRMTIGGAVLGPQDVRPDSVRRNADYALYHAKETQKGEFVRYWPGIASRMKQRQDAVREMLEALEDGRIAVHYQPVVRLDTYEIIGFEALCRVISPAGHILPAALFRDAFTDAGVGSQLTDRMLNLVARDIRFWLDRGLAVQHVGVNMTSSDFYIGNLETRLHTPFAAYQVPLRHLIVEVTEEAYIGQRDDVVASGIQELRRAGGRVALDDFGTGFAALTHLMSVPVDIIKIDQSFVRNLAPGHPSMAIVRGLLQIARDLNITVVVEGIETMAHAVLLRDLGAIIGQGYVFSKPVDRDKAARLLEKHAQYGPAPVPLIPAEPPIYEQRSRA